MHPNPMNNSTLTDGIRIAFYLTRTKEAKTSIAGQLKLKNLNEIALGPLDLVVD